MKNLAIKKIKSWEQVGFPESTTQYVTKYQIQVSEKGNAWVQTLECRREDLINLRDQIDKLIQDTPTYEVLGLSEEEGAVLDKCYKDDPICKGCTYKLSAHCKTCIFELDSPLERKLFLEMKRRYIKFDHQYAINWKGEQVSDYSKKKRLTGVLTVADFFIQKKDRKLCIYTDGHTYHERTEEQAMRDRNIDRQLQELGYTVKRYTGKEVNENISSVLEEIESWINKDQYSYR